METSRFVCSSSALSLGLLSRSRNGLWVGLGLAVLAHVWLTQITQVRQADRAAKPLTTQFVKRRPRLTKPLDLKKRPQPKRRRSLYGPKLGKPEV